MANYFLALVLGLAAVGAGPVQAFAVQGHAAAAAADTCVCSGPGSCACGAGACECDRDRCLVGAAKYRWKAMSNGDLYHLSLEKDGRPVGTLRLADGKYWDYSAGPLTERRPPLGPPKERPKAAPLRAITPDAYYAPQWSPFSGPGDCPGGT